MENKLQTIISFNLSEKLLNIKLAGSLSVEEAPYLKSKLRSLLPPPHTRLHLDLTGITECDLAGINALISLYRQWHSSQLCVLIFLASETPLTPFLHLTKFDQILPIQTTALNR